MLKSLSILKSITSNYDERIDYSMPFSWFVRCATFPACHKQICKFNGILDSYI